MIRRFVDSRPKTLCFKGEIPVHIYSKLAPRKLLARTSSSVLQCI